MSFETKFLFPLGRVTILLASIIIILIIIIYGLNLINLNMSKETITQVYINPGEINKIIEPFGPVSEVGKPIPFSRAISPQEKLDIFFPNSSKILNLFSSQDKTEENADMILENISEAQTLGDLTDKYIENAIEVLKSIKKEDLRLTGYKIYHKKRILRLQEIEVIKTRIKTETTTRLVYIGISFIFLLLIILILTIFSVERNTRFMLEKNQKI